MITFIKLSSRNKWNQKKEEEEFKISDYLEDGGGWWEDTELQLEI